MKTSLNVPTVQQYIDAMRKASGEYVVAGLFYRDPDRADIARRRLAEQWAEDDRRRVQRITSAYMAAH